MAKQRPQASGGGRTKGARQRLINQRLNEAQRNGGIIQPGGGADPFSPNPYSTKQNFPVPPEGGNFQMVNNSGKSIIDKIFAATRKPNLDKRLAKGLPPLQKPAPGVITPGSGVGRISAIAASSGGGGGVPAGRPTQLDTSLHVNNKGLAARAQNAASLEYNPQIDAIRNLITTTQKEGQHAIADTTGAYTALQKSDAAAIPGLNQTYDDQQAKTQALYDALVNQTNSQYDQTKQNNAAQFERLGIQQADPTNNKLSGDQAFITAIARLQGQGANDASELLQKGATGLALNNSQTAGLAGANAGGDLRRNLADELLKLRGNQTSLVGSKAKARRELLDQYTTEATAQAERNRAFGLDAAQFNESVLQDRRNFRQSQENSQANLALGAARLQQQSAQQASKQQAADYKNLDPQERAAAKADQLVPGSGARMFAYLQNLINSDKNIRRGFYVRKDSTGRTQQVKITPEEFGYLARKHAKITGLPAGSVQKIATAYWMER